MTSLTPIKGAENLLSEWTFVQDLSGLDPPVRLEGEINDVIVRGTIPDCVDGTFYRIGQDKVTPPGENYLPWAGNGVVTAFRIHKGRVDFKIKYVHNDKYKIDKNQRQGNFTGLEGSPWLHHPCVQAVIEQTTSTNVVHWAGRLHALSENGTAFTLDPDTLETTGMDPYRPQIRTPTFTAHPHIDPHTDTMIAYSAQPDNIISFSIDRQGRISNEHHISVPDHVLCHDCAVTENWIVFAPWPTRLRSDIKEGMSPMFYDPNIPTRLVVVPRRPDQPLAGSGWKPYEARTYIHPENSAIIHTAGAWENEDGKIVLEGTWPKNLSSSIFPWLAPDPKNVAGNTIVELVRFEINPLAPDKHTLKDPEVLVDIPNEFCRIDERYTTKPSDIVFMNVFHSDSRETLEKPIFSSLNAVAMLTKSTKELKIYYPGPSVRCMEPVFIARSDSAPEGDGYVIFAVDRFDVNLTNLVILDTTGDFQAPTAVIELPLRLRAQIHGNWVNAKEVGSRPLVPIPPLNHMNFRL
ncbi:Lignostilbene-alpha,beta-dioxygenase isozyme III [Curvularia clavata]|uniref:Lignostilbene-alpha,beta-dioxygenase isozyme III n=1 Tax=Curvularia clavata TaxID=95742 RepID=A0A9Q8ZCW0_CURCL|nr:Lignostilbene-alpha,beta-dioxygenase isozyme III [Curvularia clavata]